MHACPLNKQLAEESATGEAPVFFGNSIVQLLKWFWPTSQGTRVQRPANLPRVPSPMRESRRSSVHSTRASGIRTVLNAIFPGAGSGSRRYAA